MDAKFINALGKTGVISRLRLVHMVSLKFEWRGGRIESTLSRISGRKYDNVGEGGKEAFKSRRSSLYDSPLCEMNSIERAPRSRFPEYLFSFLPPPPYAKLDE